MKVGRKVHIFYLKLNILPEINSVFENVAFKQSFCIHAVCLCYCLLRDFWLFHSLFFELLHLIFPFRTPRSWHLKFSVSNNQALIIFLNLDFFFPAWLQKQEVCCGVLFFFHTINCIVCLLYWYSANSKFQGNWNKTPENLIFKTIV